MKNEITLYNRKIPYSIRKSTRAKRLRIAVYLNCDVVVTLPYHKNISDVEAYLKQKSKWISAKLDYFREARGLNIKNKSISFSDNKEAAYKLAMLTVKRFSNLYGFEYNKILIKNHKSKWGSCSRKGNLNFNYRIVFLPKRLAEYIVVHELCHLVELSHSQKYWRLVEKALPNYKELIANLKKYY